MKIYNVLAVLITLLTALSASADPGIRDTVRIGEVNTIPGNQIKVPVNFYNDELLNAVEVVLKFDNTKLALDSFSLAGGRLDYIDTNTVFSVITDSTIDINVMEWTSGSYIEAGNGLFCNLYFQVDPGATPGITEIDTTTTSLGFHTLFADMSAQPIYPEFVKGIVNINEPPPSTDSVWVEEVTGSPGQTVVVNVYAFNSEDISRMKLALTYSSDNLIYNSTNFVGTRGASAASKIVSPQESLRQLLIDLIYSSESPLPPGEGPMATILFDIAPSTPDGIITIDSASYLNAQPLEITLTDEYGGLTFTPRFTAGHVEVKAATAVGDGSDNLIPENYALMQNVPNPFNPATVIQFDLPQASDVRLEVFNIIGQKVKTLVNGQLPAGHHKITFEGRGDNEQVLSSGVYFYRISAGDFRQSKKMTLVK